MLPVGASHTHLNWYMLLWISLIVEFYFTSSLDTDYVHWLIRLLCWSTKALVKPFMALATFSHLHHLEMAVASQSPVPKRALETIELLRSELERCQVDLEMDEELFAEKVEEVNELQKNYDLLLQEKERIERLWVSAKETETRLQSEVQQLLEKLFSMESELSEQEAIIQQQRDSLEKENEKGGVLSAKEHTTRLNVGVQAFLATPMESEPETSSDKLEHRSEVLIEEDNSVDSLQEESRFVPLLQQTLVDFTANRSLLEGKVETSRMEVRTYRGHFLV